MSCTLGTYVHNKLTDPSSHFHMCRYWPNRYVNDESAQSTLALFSRIVRSGRHLSIMAHFSHPRELETPLVQEAIRRIRATGAQIRCQAPLIRGINDQPELWSRVSPKSCWCESLQVLKWSGSDVAPADPSGNDTVSGETFWQGISSPQLSLLPPLPTPLQVLHVCRARHRCQTRL